MWTTEHHRLFSEIARHVDHIIMLENGVRVWQDNYIVEVTGHDCRTLYCQLRWLVRKVYRPLGLSTL